MYKFGVAQNNPVKAENRYSIFCYIFDNRETPRIGHRNEKEAKRSYYRYQIIHNHIVSENKAMNTDPSIPDAKWNVN